MLIYKVIQVSFGLVNLHNYLVAERFENVRLQIHLTINNEKLRLKSIQRLVGEND